MYFVGAESFRNEDGRYTAEVRIHPPIQKTSLLRKVIKTAQSLGCQTSNQQAVTVELGRSDDKRTYLKVNNIRLRSTVLDEAFHVRVVSNLATTWVARALIEQGHRVVELGK